MNLNKVFLIGRLTRDPQTRALPSGQPVASFGIATDRFFTDKSGQKQQQTEFHNVVAFGKTAEIASQYLAKGALTMIEGRLQTRNWQDKTGNQRTRTEIIVERLQLGPRSAQSARKENTAPENQSIQQNTKPSQEDIPVIEEEIDVKDIPF